MVRQKNLFKDGETLSKIILEQLNVRNMRQTIERFNTLYRYTGHPDGEAAVDYLVERLRQYGVPTERLFYDAYLSLPLDASLEVLSPSSRVIKVIADVYSGEASDLRGPLFYDRFSEKKNLSQKEEKARFAEFRGKFILTRSSGGSFAKKSADAGALGVIHLWPSAEPLHHHGTTGAVWGSPVPADQDQFPYLPFVEMTKDDAESLLALLSEGKNVEISMNIKMDNGVRRTSMPVAAIQGGSEKYVLISGHYDSWYEGITDNAASDAIMLEFARIFWEHRKDLKRSVKIAWWSGHSDGRYAGSTWYCDSHWEDLDKNCVAHINIDLAGCKNADQIRARTTLMEGRAFMDDLIREFTGRAALPYIPMIRGADQSFWGVGVPIAIMPKYEPLPENCDFCCPSGGPWWHTDADTIDKLDERIMFRDASLNAKMACLILNSDRLPVDIPGFAAEMEKFLSEINEALGDEFVLDPVLKALADLKKELPAFCEKTLSSEDSDEILKVVAGELVRLVYSVSSPYYQDRAVGALPFQGVKNACGVTRANTDADVYVFIQTDFMRQRNRLTGQLRRVIRDIQNYMSLQR